MFKNELQKTIQEQNDKIHRLEKAFRGRVILSGFEFCLDFEQLSPLPTDVTAAYKSALSEKEALQKSVKLLNESDKAGQGSATGADTNEHQEKISTLTNNIQVLIEAKTKIENGFQIERKKFKVFRPLRSSWHPSEIIENY
jgi:hypothetical protein